MHLSENSYKYIKYFTENFRGFAFFFVLFSQLLFPINLFSQTGVYEKLELRVESMLKDQNYDSVISVSIQMKDWTFRFEGDTSLRYAASLRYQGMGWHYLQEMDSAKSCYNQSLYALEKQKRTVHPLYAKTLNNLGILYWQLGDNDKAEILYKRAIEIRLITIGEDHPDYATSLNNLGILYDEKGDIKAAETIYCQALEIRRRSLGEDHHDFATSVANLSVLYYNMGDYNKAESLGVQALNIRKNALGEGHPDYTASVANLGDLYFDLGDYKLAESYCKQALIIRKKILGENHWEYAASLNNLGTLYKTIGDFKAAESYYKQASKIFKDVLGHDHYKYASSLNNLGNLYLDIGDFKTAKSVLTQSMENYKKALGTEHPLYAASINNIGSLYQEIGDYKTADSLFKQSMQIYKIANGDEHADVGMSLNNLGFLHKTMGEFKTAEEYFKRSLEIRKKVLGPMHPDYVNTLNNLADLYVQMGDYLAAETFYYEAMAIKLEHLSTNFSWLSSKERDAYWKQEEVFFNDLNNFMFNANNIIPSSSELAFNANLVSKALMLETSRELDQIIAKSSDENLKLQFSEMKQLRRIFLKMQSEDSPNLEIMERYKNQADSIDKILVNTLGEYASSMQKFKITWKDVQANLTPSDVAIEFVHYYDYKDSSNNYAAILVRPDYKYPKFVKLGAESSLHAAIQNRDFSILFDLVWKNLDSLLFGIKTIYYCPSGELNNVSFSALCFQSGDSINSTLTQNRGAEVEIAEIKNETCNKLLIDKYTLHQLTSTRYLADGSLERNKILDRSIALYGGINYDEIPTGQDPLKIDISNEDFTFQMNLWSPLSSRDIKKKGKRYSSSKRGKMEYLPGTKHEVQYISSLLSSNHWEINTKLDKQASEYILKDQFQKYPPAVLHIATHGFAFPDHEKKESMMSIQDQENLIKISEDPMVRCGLMFSGSNISWSGNPQRMIEETGDDGILTAAEVANFDLSTTKLVVLSACETGLGKVEGSEGTFGLKRGFKLAGVEQIIVSLWSVPDKETMELMSYFYDNLSKSLDPVISFEKAQKVMRDEYPNEPVKWAGFVLVR